MPGGGDNREWVLKDLDDRVALQERNNVSALGVFTDSVIALSKIHGHEVLAGLREAALRIGFQHNGTGVKLKSLAARPVLLKGSSAFKHILDCLRA